MTKYKPEQFLVGDYTRVQWRAGSYVYVIQAGEDGPVKIGSAVHPVSRIGDLQGGSWMELFLVGIVPAFGRHLALERQAHLLAKDFNIRGEWFDLHPIEALDAILAAAVRVGVDAMPLEQAEAKAKEDASARMRQDLDEREANDMQKTRIRMGLC